MMRKRALVGCVLVLGCTLVLSGVTWAVATSLHGEHPTWGVTLHLDTPNLVPPAVQWAILDKDPVPIFRARLKEKPNVYRESLEQDDREGWKQVVDSMYMSGGWDHGFKEVTGQSVYLLTSAPDAAYGVYSERSDGGKWIATKIVKIKERPVCWCIPIEVKAGEEIEVTLTEDNAFGLEAVYDETMRELSQSQ